MKHLAHTAPVSEAAVANAAAFRPRPRPKQRTTFSLSAHGFKSFRITFSRKF
jgi:hypothetical protein